MSSTLLIPPTPAYWNSNYELSFYLTNNNNLPPDVRALSSAAFIFPFDKDLNLLLGKHSTRGYDLAGGKLEKGETPEEAA